MRLLNEGEAYLLVACLFVATGCAICVAWVNRDTHIRRLLSHEAVENLRQQIEPRDDLPYAGVQVLLTRAAERIFREDFSSETSVALKSASDVRKAFINLATLAVLPGSQFDSDRIGAIEQFGIARSLRDQEFLMAKLNKARENFDLVDSDRSKALLALNMHACRSGIESTSLTAWCNEMPVGSATSIIPVQAGMSNMRSRGFEDLLPSPGAIKDAAVAQLLDAVVALLPNDDTRGRGRIDFVQAYFISPNSVLRIWSPEPSFSVLDANKTKLWAQSSYARKMWEPTAESYHTLPYLDIAGKGFVETVCNTVSHQPGSLEVLGVICTDLALNAAGVKSLSVELDRVLSVNFRWVEEEPRAGHVEGSFREPDDASNYETDSAKNSSGGQVVPIFVDGEYGFFIPAPVRFGRGGWIATASKPRPIIEVFVVGLILLAIGGGLLISIRNSLRRDAVQRDRAALLKSLPVGYCEIMNSGDILDIVSYANNRMEEIMGVGTQGRLAGMSLLKQVERICHIGQSDGEVSAKRIERSKLAELLQVGSIEFYCFVIHARQWARVRASRVVYSGKELHAFAIAEIVDDRRLVALLEETV
ncbi:MAG: hypothetical protein H7A19_07290 [Rhodanobacteraceae bacterium]|nr:hypothetical protein [Rhodanobacteraceae bacterium]